MSMKTELKKLKAQRRVEIKNLHLTYLRTKRDIKRSVSPDRLIRKHLAISIGVAALGGLLLAPHLGRRDKKRRQGPGLGAKITGWLRSMVQKVSPAAAEYIPDMEHREQAEPAAERTEFRQEEPHARESKHGAIPPGLMKSLVSQLAMLLVTKLDLPRVIGGLMHRAERDGHRGNGHGKPRITVADAGALHEDSGE